MADFEESAMARSLARINEEAYRFKRPGIREAQGAEAKEGEILHHVEKRDGKFPEMEALFYGDKDKFYKELRRVAWGS
jgi:hypothetical protein